MVVLQFLGILVMVFAAIAAIVGGPLSLGYFLGKRVFPRFQRLPNWSHFAPSVLGVLCILVYTIHNVSHDAPSAAETHFLISIYSLFVVCFFTIGIMFAKKNRFFQTRAEKQLAAWQKQLSKDEASGSSIQTGFDYQRIGELYGELGKTQEAVSSYERAYSILSEELGNHPQLRNVIGAYSNALRVANQTAEADKLQERLTAIASPDDVTQG